MICYLLMCMKIMIIENDKNFPKDLFAHIAYECECDFLFCRYDDCFSVLSLNKCDMVIIDICEETNDIMAFCHKLINVQNDIKISFLSEKEFDVKSINSNFVDFCLKANGKFKLLNLMSIINKFAKRRNVFIRTFGSFDVFIDGVPINFISAKSKELLALLVDNNGSIVSMGMVLCCFWPEKDASLSKILYRDAVWKLRKSLCNYQIEDLVCFQRGKLFLNRENTRCDYFDFLDGNYALYNHEYMVNYDWSIDRQMQLDDIKK